MKLTQTIKKPETIVENFLCTLDSLEITTETTMPTETLIHYLKRLGHEFSEEDDE